MTGAGFAAIVSRAVCLGLLFILTLGAASGRDAEPDSKAPDCLSSPRGAAPKGERWYYRVERNTKRHCWYTRGGTGVERKEAERTLPMAEASKRGDPPAQEPLQLSVANARAEADLSAIPKPDANDAPRDVEPAVAPEHPTWKLAERWAEHQRSDQPVEPLSARPSATTPQTVPATLDLSPPHTVDESYEQPEHAIYLAGLVLALLGVSTMLVAILIRRRRMAASNNADWHFGRRAQANADLDAFDDDVRDDALPAPRRALPAKRQREARRMVSLRDGALHGALKLPMRPMLFPELPNEAADKIR